MGTKTSNNSFLQYTNGAWEASQLKINPPKDVIKCLTYNVWFDKHNFDLRVIELLKIIQIEDADFICLQEVTVPFFEALQSNAHIREHYYISNNKRDWYGILILQKFCPEQIIQVNFETYQSRSLLYSQTKIGDKLLYLGCVHLESQDAAYQIRFNQLQTIYQHMHNNENVIIMGDFNYDCKNGEKERNLDPNYTDSWPQLHQDNGFTMKETTRFAAWRPDKVLVKKSSKVKITEMRLVGAYDLDIYKGQQYSKDEITTPSDHLGLVTMIQLL